MWRIPSNAQKSAGVNPLTGQDATFTPLVAGGSFTSVIFTTQFLPLFDLFVFADQILNLQLQTRFQGAAPGDTWRDTDQLFVIQPGPPAFRLPAFRVVNFQARWILSNPGAVPCAITEFVMLNRSV